MIERLAVALWGGTAVTLIGLGGSELLFAPASEGIGLEATLLPSLAAGGAMFVHLMRDHLDDSISADNNRPIETLRASTDASVAQREHQDRAAA